LKGKGLKTQSLKGKSNMKNILIYLAMTLALLTLAACGGGGGGDNGTAGQNPQPTAKTTAALKINLTGTLPDSAAIAGTDFTLTLPANVTPAMTNGAVSTGVVSLSGTFAGGTQTPPVYTAATESAPGTLKVILVNPINSGVTQVGEVATITLQLANSAAPTTGSFGVSAVSVIDAALYNTISGMGASVADVSLQ
jgi:hypothetical protein